MACGFRDWRRSKTVLPILFTKFLQPPEESLRERSGEGRIPSHPPDRLREWMKYAVVTGADGEKPLPVIPLRLCPRQMAAVFIYLLHVIQKIAQAIEEQSGIYAGQYRDGILFGDTQIIEKPHAYLTGVGGIIKRTCRPEEI